MSSIPPDTAAEVEKLEELHQQHPEGRYFVPLADRYRKLGMVEQAEELLREGLRKHPDYLSAHIVLGGCLADRGVQEEAADEFRYVLSQDPQNLIALRTLGELAAQGGRGAEAERWYGELLAVDPMNKEARQALDALAGDHPEPQTTDTVGATDPGASHAVDDPDQLQDWGTVLLDAPDAPPLDAEADRFDPGTFSEVTFTTAGGDDEEPGDDAVLSADLDLSPLSMDPDGVPAEAASDQEGWTLLDFGDDLAEGGVASEDGEEEVVTETIADLYAQQGLHDRAAGVYRELIQRRGGDAALEAKLAASERAARGEEVADDEIADPDDFLTFSEDEFGGTDPGETAFDASGYDDEELGSASLAAAETEQPQEADAFAASFTGGFEGLGDAAGWAEPEDLARSPGRDHAAAAEDDLQPSSAQSQATEGVPASSGSAPAIRDWFADLLDWTPGAARTGAAAALDEPPPADEPWPESRPASRAAEPEQIKPLALVEELGTDADAGTAEVTPAEEEEEEDLSWLTDILDDGALASEQEAGAPAAEASQPPEGASDNPEADAGDEDLASFQAWLQSLKR